MLFPALADRAWYDYHDTQTATIEVLPMFEGAMNTEMMIFFLTMVYYYYGCKQVMIILDRLSSPIAAKDYFERTHPDWFLVEYLPPYSPELNPVEQCWQYMKNVAMVNFVPMCRKKLEAKAEEAVQAINADPILLPSFFHHAKLKLWKISRKGSKRRNIVERNFHNIKQCRRVFTRYDKLDDTYNAFIAIAYMCMHMKN